MVVGVKRAFFHLKSQRLTYVQLLSEDAEHGEENMCGRLNCSMYGTRDAAVNLANGRSERLKKLGFAQRLATPCVFIHKERGPRAYAHGERSLGAEQGASMDQ